MSQEFQLGNGVKVWLSQKHFAEGGEALLYRVEGPIEFKNQVAKIYKQGKRTTAKLKKLEFLKGNCPSPFKAENKIGAVVWVNQIIYQNKVFHGFLMRYADGIRLEDLCMVKLNPKIGPEWRRFQLGQNEALSLRLKLCYNIAVAVAQLHNEQLGAYTLMDLKPENIIVLPNGHVSIIDIDSAQVLSNGKVLFQSDSRSPEYTPPESYRRRKNLNQSEWDCFSLAVIFYRLLLGIHPYTGTCKPPYEALNEKFELIEHGLFPMGRKRQYFKVIPPPHQQFLQLDIQIRNLFLRCFDQGHDDLSIRPSAREWMDTLRNLLTTKTIHDQLVAFRMKWLVSPIQFPLPLLERFHFNLTPTKTHKNLIRSSLNRWLGKSSKESLASELSILFTKIASDHRKLTDFQVREEALTKWFAEMQKGVIANHILELNKIVVGIEKAEANIQSQLVEGNEKKKVQIEKQLEELIKEKVHLEAAHENILNELSEYESRKTELYHNLLRERKNLEKEASKKAEAIKKSILAERDSIIAPTKRSIEILTSQKESRLDQLDKQKEKDIAAELDRKKRELKVFLEKKTSILETHLIRQNAHLIFTDSYSNPLEIAAELERNGFRSAADIIEVYELGAIVSQKGLPIKIIGIGKTRGKDLRDWITRIKNIVSNALGNSEANIEKKSQHNLKHIDEDAEKTKSLLLEEYERSKNDLIKNQPNLAAELEKLKEKYKTQIEAIKATLAEEINIKSKRLEAFAQKSIFEIFPEARVLTEKSKQYLGDKQETERKIERKKAEIKEVKPFLYEEKLKFIFDHFETHAFELRAKASSEIESLKQKAIVEHAIIRSEHNALIIKMKSQTQNYNLLLGKYNAL